MPSYRFESPPQLDISVIIPVYNEEFTLPRLCKRLLATLDGIGRSYEIIFVDDKSRDDSRTILETLYKQHPDKIRVIELVCNTGQHRAILAGFCKMRGKIAFTLDCDLQNPPEEIPNLLARIEEGFDSVGGVRSERHDSRWRKLLSYVSNGVRGRISTMRMQDHGCMLRAYDRELVERMIASPGATPYVPELSWRNAKQFIEIPVKHDARSEGESNYNLSRLLRLNADLLTASSIAPLQILTLLGVGLSATTGIWLFFMFLSVLTSSQGSRLDVYAAMISFMISLVIIGIGLVGEYIGRIYLEVRDRPHFHIGRILG